MKEVGCMKYRITYKGTQQCTRLNNSKDLVAWLKANKNNVAIVDSIEDIVKDFSNWKYDSDSVFDSWKIFRHMTEGLFMNGLNWEKIYATMTAEQKAACEIYNMFVQADEGKTNFKLDNVVYN